MTVGRSRVWFAVFVAAVFTAGVATGLMLRGSIDPPTSAADGDASAGAFGRPSLGRVSRQLATELDLTRDQQRQLEEILLARRVVLMNYRRSVRAQVGVELTAVTEEIDRILTPEQRERLGDLGSRIQAHLYADPAPAAPER